MPAKRKSSVVERKANSQPGQALLVFPVADKWFALPLESVRAVLRADLLQPLAGGSDNLAGWVEVHGQEVLVLDITQTLVPGAHNGSPQQIILLRAGASWTGLTTAGTPETINIPAEQMQRTCELPDSSRWAMGICRADGRTITMLDPDLFVGDLCPAS